MALPTSPRDPCLLAPLLPRPGPKLGLPSLTHFLPSAPTMQADSPIPAADPPSLSDEEASLVTHPPSSEQGDAQTEGWRRQ